MIANLFFSYFLFLYFNYLSKKYSKKIVCVLLVVNSLYLFYSEDRLDNLKKNYKIKNLSTRLMLKNFLI
jgi:hypothetical protein